MLGERLAAGIRRLVDRLPGGPTVAIPLLIAVLPSVVSATALFQLARSDLPTFYYILLHANLGALWLLFVFHIAAYASLMIPVIVAAYLFLRFARHMDTGQLTTRRKLMSIAILAVAIGAGLAGPLMSRQLSHNRETTLPLLLAPLFGILLFASTALAYSATKRVRGRTTVVPAIWLHRVQLYYVLSVRASLVVYVTLALVPPIMVLDTAIPTEYVDSRDSEGNPSRMMGSVLSVDDTRLLMITTLGELHSIPTEDVVRRIPNAAGATEIRGTATIEQSNRDTN